MVWKYKHICVYVHIFQVYLNHCSYSCPEVLVYLILALLKLNLACLHRKDGEFATKNKCCIKLWLLPCVQADQPNWLKFSHSVHHLLVHLCLQLVTSVNWLFAFIVEVLGAACKCYFTVYLPSVAVSELSRFYGNYLDHSGVFVLDYILMCF